MVSSYSIGFPVVGVSTNETCLTFDKLGGGAGSWEQEQVSLYTEQNQLARSLMTEVFFLVSLGTLMVTVCVRARVHAYVPADHPTSRLSRQPPYPVSERIRSR